MPDLKSKEQAQFRTKSGRDQVFFFKKKEQHPNLMQ